MIPAEAQDRGRDFRRWSQKMSSRWLQSARQRLHWRRFLTPLLLWWLPPCRDGAVYVPAHRPEARQGRARPLTRAGPPQSPCPQPSAVTLWTASRPSTPALCSAELASSARPLARSLLSAPLRRGVSEGGEQKAFVTSNLKIRHNVSQSLVAYSVEYWLALPPGSSLAEVSRCV